MSGVGVAYDYDDRSMVDGISVASNRNSDSPLVPLVEPPVQNTLKSPGLPYGEQFLPWMTTSERVIPDVSQHSSFLFLVVKQHPIMDEKGKVIKRFDGIGLPVYAILKPR